MQRCATVREENDLKPPDNWSVCQILLDKVHIAVFALWFVERHEKVLSKEKYSPQDFRKELAVEVKQFREAVGDERKHLPKPLHGEVARVLWSKGKLSP